MSIGHVILYPGYCNQKLLWYLEFVARGTVGFFTNSPQYKNANIANFVLAVPLERNSTNEVYNLGK